MKLGILLFVSVFAFPVFASSPPPCPGAFQIDPSYIEVTEETGGQIYMLNPSEAQKAAPLMTKGLKQIDDTILRLTGEIKDSQKEFIVPVDTTVSVLTFSGFIQCLKSVTILDPTGSEVVSGPQVEDTKFQSGRFLLVNTPQPGDWKIRISGTGFFSVVADAKSDIQILDVAFVQLEGRPGHEGYFKIKGNPKKGISQTLSAQLDGDTNTVQFVLIQSDGMMTRLTLDRVPGTSDPAEYMGSVIPPDKPFRIAAEGIDASGLIYRRFFAPLFHAE